MASLETGVVIMSQTISTANLDLILESKYKRLISLLQSLEAVVVAFSGGVDSSLLAVVAHQVLSPHMLAVTIHSEVETEGIMAVAQSIAGKFGFPHQVIKHEKLQDADYVQNSPDRCYVCKTVDLGIISQIARKAGIKHVLMGANVDDLGDYRPGLRAAKEMEVLSPLAETGFTKKDVRSLAQVLGLVNWNHPSSPCLASRIPYGSPVTLHKLEQIAAGEAYLRALYFPVVRVRNNEYLARIEVPITEISRLVSLREEITSYFKQIGFRYITVDLDGFRTGSLNEVLPMRSESH